MPMKDTAQAKAMAHTAVGCFRMEGRGAVGCAAFAAITGTAWGAVSADVGVSSIERDGSRLGSRGAAARDARRGGAMGPG
ncbi:hypothetical protein GCM10009693_02930 [Leucobacter chromiireducens subsp. chromiireducens]